MSGPSTEWPTPPRRPPLDWVEAREVAMLYWDAFGAVPDYLAAYLATGDEGELGRLPHDPGE